MENKMEKCCILGVKKIIACMLVSDSRCIYIYKVEDALYKSQYDVHSYLGQTLNPKPYFLTLPAKLSTTKLALLSQTRNPSSPKPELRGIIRVTLKGYSGTTSGYMGII